MHTFKLSNGTDWPFVITMGTIIKVETLTGVNVVAALAQSGFEGLAHHMKAIAALPYYGATTPDHGHTFEQYADLLVGDASDHMERKCLRALIDYLPDKKKRILLPLLEASEEADRKLTETAAKEATPERLRQVVAKEADRRLAVMRERLAKLDKDKDKPPEKPSTPPSNVSGAITGD